VKKPGGVFWGEDRKGKGELKCVKGTTGASRILRRDFEWNKKVEKGKNHLKKGIRGGNATQEGRVKEAWRSVNGVQERVPNGIGGGGKKGKMGEKRISLSVTERGRTFLGWGNIVGEPKKKWAESNWGVTTGGRGTVTMQREKNFYFEVAA